MLKYSLPRGWNAHSVQVFDRHALIGERDDAEHQRGADHLSQSSILLKYGPQSRQRFSTAHEVRFDLFWGKRLHRHSVVDSYASRLSEIFARSATDDDGKQTMILPIHIDRLYTGST